MVLLSIDFANLHTILETLYGEMMPLCEEMMDVGKGLAGLGALFYVAVRVWQSMARAEPVDVYPLLRPFAIGICILLFPTLVLGTLNSVLSPIVQGTHKMLEGQTLDMEQYRAQKEELEREAMLRNPETAHLVSDEEFDRQLDELGWSVVDTASRLGMYVEVGMYNLEKKIRDAFRSLLELIFAAASLLIDTVRTFFLVVLSILGPVAFAFSVWDRFPVHARTVVHALYLRLSVASGERPVQHSARQAPGTDAPERHPGVAEQSRLLDRQLQQRVHNLYAHRDYRVLHRPDGGGLDRAGGRCRKLQPQPEPDSHESGQFCCRSGRFRTGKHRRTAERKITKTGLRDAYAAYGY